MRLESSIKNVLSILAITLLAQAALGQSSTAKFSFISRATTAGATELVLTNSYTTALEAFHAIAHCGINRSELVVDGLLYNTRSLNLSPGGSSAFRTPGVPVGCEMVVDAVIFADGTSAGVASAISGMLQARQGTDNEVLQLKSSLISAHKAGMTVDEVKSYIVERHGVVKTLGSADQPNIRGRNAFLAALNKYIRSSSPEESQQSNHSNSVPLSATASSAVSMVTLESWDRNLHLALQTKVGN